DRDGHHLLGEHERLDGRQRHGEGREGPGDREGAVLRQAGGVHRDRHRRLGDRHHPGAAVRLPPPGPRLQAGGEAEVSGQWAVDNLGYARPTGRTIINLAPADLKKDAGAFDLPITLGILVATRQLAADQVEPFASVGELALDGSVRPVNGVLSMAMEARARDVKKLIVPAANAREASVVRDVEVYGVGSLADAVGVVSGEAGVEPVSPPDEIEARLNQY